jgi:hypothetical protein
MERKRPKGNDATQDLSLSDLIVPGKPPTAPPTIAPRGSAKNPASAKNDMSLWGGVVLGTQDFAPPVAPKRNPKKWIIVGVAGAALVAVVLYFVFHTTDAKKSGSAAADVKGGAASDMKAGATGDMKAGATGDMKAAATSNAGTSTVGTSNTAGSNTAGSNTAGTAGSNATGSAASNTTGAGSGASTSAGAAVPSLMADGKEVDAISGVASVIRAKKAPARKVVKKTAKAKTPVKKAPIKKKKR